MPEHTHASLTIHFFGSFDVQISGSPLPPLRSRKGAWLLALLVLRHGREVQREWLQEALWPDSEPERAARSLRQSLYDLRKALGQEARRLVSPTLQTLRLNLERSEVDLLTFRETIAKGDAASLETAVSLYQGSLLEGCLEEWVLHEREICEQAYSKALETLAAHAMAISDFAVAVSYLRKAAAANPVREETQQALMRALENKGEYQECLQVYRIFWSRLKEQDPKAQPGLETMALYDKIRDRTHKQPPTATPSADLPSHATGCIPHPLTELIGREAEIKEVEYRLSGRLVTLTGSGGVGKTRLAIHVAHRVADRYAEGARFIDLSALTDPSLVAQQIAVGLGIRDMQGQAILETLLGHLCSKQMLIVLDNCEHLATACADLAHRLLQHCPNLHILATSRHALQVAGEAVWRVASLSVPELDRVPDGKDVTEGLMTYEAVQLFVERSRRHRPDLSSLRVTRGLWRRSACGWMAFPWRLS